MAAYSPRVQEYFRRSPRDPGSEATGEAGSLGCGTLIRFGLDIVDGHLRHVGFRAFACPHIIAACHRACERLEGAPVAELAALQTDELQQEFEIPVEKAGKLLILKDALLACDDSIKSRSG